MQLAQRLFKELLKDYGPRPTAHDQRAADHGPRPTTSGRRPTTSGRRTAGGGRRAAGGGRRTAGGGRRAAGGGRRAAGGGRRAAGGGRRTTDQRAADHGPAGGGRATTAHDPRPTAIDTTNTISRRTGQGPGTWQGKHRGGPPGRAGMADGRRRDRPGRVPD